jgi:hypothetical protein
MPWERGTAEFALAMRRRIGSNFLERCSKDGTQM